MKKISYNLISTRKVQTLVRVVILPHLTHEATIPSSLGNYSITERYAVTGRCFLKVIEIENHIVEAVNWKD